MKQGLPPPHGGNNNGHLIKIPTNQREFLKPKGGSKTTHHPKAFLNLTRQRIEEEIVEVRDTIEEIKTALREPRSETSAFTMGSACGTDVALLELNACIATKQQTYLEALLATKRRLEGGTYGRCDSCGHLIETGRLQATPIAKQCLSCKKRNGSR